MASTSTLRRFWSNCIETRTRHMFALFVLLVLVAHFCHEASTLRLVSLRIPRYTIRGQPVRLECHYDLENEALYSVKWYKDGKEFYRFLPGDYPPARTFDLRGFTVDKQNSTDTAVILKNVDLGASGVYRCEVSGEAPAFQTVIENSQMMVVDLPDDGPQIEGSNLRYSIEDVVRVNCTSPRAKPAAKLVWHINGDVAEERFIRRYPIFIEKNGLETSVLGLHFEIKRHHFKSGDLKIKCVAKIEDFYWRTNEERVLPDYPERSPALESKATFNSGVRPVSTLAFVTSHFWSLFVGYTACSLIAQLFVERSSAF